MPKMQLHTNRLIFLLCICIMSFTSCVTYSTLCDVPLIEKKNDVVVTSGIAMPIPAINTSAAYGITNHLAIQSHAYLILNTDFLVQQSLGYYTTLPSGKIIENYYGIAYGKGHEIFNMIDYRDYHKSAKYFLFFTQYNVGKYNPRNSHIQYGFSIKSGYIYSFVTQGYYDGYDGSETPSPNGYNHYRSHSIFCSPMGFIRFGNKKILYNFHVQLQLHAGINDYIYNSISSFPFSAGFSMQYRPYKTQHIYTLNNTKHIEFVPSKYNSTITLSLCHKFKNDETLSWMIISFADKVIQKYSSAFSLTYDNSSVVNRYSVGGAISYHKKTGNILNYEHYENGILYHSDFSFTVTQLNLAVRLLYHYYNTKKFEFYSGVRLGVNLINREIQNKPKDVIEEDLFLDKSSSPSVQLIPIGVRYLLTDHWGIQTELAIGQPYFLSFGIQSRF